MPYAEIVQSAPLPNVYAPARTARPSYLNYALHASLQDTSALFDYGIRMGSGVAQISTLARAIGDGRAFALTGFAWQRHSEADNTLIIGDAQSARGKYEESVRFDGVQYAGSNFSYDAGWERTDFGDAPMHLGGFTLASTARQQLSRRFEAQAHFFSDRAATLIGIGGQWTTPRAGNITFGIAPSAARGLTGFFGYMYHSGRLNATVDDRVFGAQSYEIGPLAPANYRQLRAALDFATSPRSKVRVQYASQAQNGFSTRALTAGYSQRVSGADLHLDFTSSRSSYARSMGFTTYLSLPLPGGTTFTQQSALSGGLASTTVALKHDVPLSGTGSGYTLNFSRNGTTMIDSTFTTQTGGSRTQWELTRIGSTTSWNAQFAGSLLFLGGRTLASNQMIDQTSAFETLRGRSTATFAIVTGNGKGVPAGSVVRSLSDSTVWRVDEGGRVTLSDIAAGTQTLLVTQASGTCIVTIAVPPSAGATPDLGTQICRRK